MDTLFIRRSVRKYLDKPVEGEKIERILRAAMQAPSATDQRPWEFLVITEKPKVEFLANFSPYAKLLKGAPAAIIVLEKTMVRAPSFSEQDLGACAENLLLQVVDEGLGAVWMGVGKGSTRERFIKDMFRLPGKVRPFAVIALGYPEDENANKFVDRYDESRVHYNK